MEYMWMQFRTQSVHVRQFYNCHASIVYIQKSFFHALHSKVFFPCFENNVVFLLYSTEEPCTELIKFARASCRDDAEDGNPADPCPVLAALNKAKLKDSDSLLAN